MQALYQLSYAPKRLGHRTSASPPLSSTPSQTDLAGLGHAGGVTGLAGAPRGPVRHVMLYGPPAAGKTTVGRALADRTGFRLVHNHVGIDAARHLFDFGAPGFWPTVRDIRVVLVARAAEHGVDIVTTYVFSPVESRAYLDALEGLVADAGGETHFVQLCPPLAVLEERASMPDRVTARKLSDPARLRALVEQHDLYGKVKAGDLSIDNSHLSPADAADRVARHLGLGGT